MNRFLAPSMGLGLLLLGCRGEGVGTPTAQNEDAGAVADARVGALGGPDVAADAAPTSVADRYIVVFKRTGAQAARAGGGKATASVASSMATTMQSTVAGAEVVRVYEHALDAATMKLSPSALVALRADSRVAYIEPDAIFRINEVQTMPTWGLDRIDQSALPLDQSYTYPGHAGDGVHAYVIDTGIYGAHSEFALPGGGSRVVPGIDTIDNDGIPDDCHGHGTHVAGTIGGSTWGVAKKVTLHAVRVLDCGGGGTTSSVIAGIDWVTANHVSPAVANMSLGGSFSQAVNDAVTNSIAAGVTYGIAAGNSAIDACSFSPASTPNAITVAASNNADTRASFSNFGTCVDLFAPGEQITSSWIGSASATNTISGTSMATPHVVGAAALWLSLHPAATPADLATALLGRATPDLIQDPGTGTPNLLLYAGGLVDGADVVPPTASITAPASGSTVTDTATITASATDDVGPVAVTQLFVNGVARLSDSQEPFSFAWDAHDLPAGSYQLVVKAIDASGNIGASAPITVTLEHAVAPASVTVAPTSVPGGTSATGTVTLNQPAPTGGTVVTLASSNPAVATVAATVTVAEGATTATFPVSTTTTAVTATVTISATIDTVTKTTLLTVRAPVSVSNLFLPSSTQGGFSASGSVTLTEAAPSAIVVALASNNAAATVPATVTVPVGSISASFTITTTTVSTNTPVVITATYPAAVSVTATMTVTPPPPPTVSFISLNSSSVGGGLPMSGIVFMQNAAPTGGAVVTMTSSNPAVASVPATITVPAGSSIGDLTITTTAVTTPVTVTISATAPVGTTVTATLTVNPPQVSFVSLSPSSVNAGSPSTGTVSLAAPAPAGGAVVSLTSSDTAVAQIPATINIPAGATSGTFGVTTTVVSLSTTVTISATYPAARTVSTTLSVNAPQVSFISLPSSVGGGASANGTIFLTTPAQAGGAVVSLVSSNPAVAQVPATITIPAGSSSAALSVTTVAVDTTTFVTISATFPAGRTVQASLNVNAPQVSFLSFSPSSVNAGASSTGTVTLAAPAPAGGAVVSLASADSSVVQVPATVTIPGGATSATFAATTTVITLSTSVAITATYPVGRTVSATLFVNAPQVSFISVPSSIGGGASAVGTIFLTTAAQAGGALVSLTSSNPAVVQVPATVTVPAGASSATFNLSSVSVPASLSVTISATFPASRTVQTSLTVNAPQVSFVSLSPSTVNGGVSSTGTVTLAAIAPAGGATIALASSNASVAQVPATITIPAGTLSGTFAVTTSVVPLSTSASISATYPAGRTVSTTLFVNAPQVSFVSLSPSSVNGGSPSTGTVTLTAPALAGDAVVALSTTNASIAMVPPSVTIAAGQTTATFPITTSTVMTTSFVSITAIYPAGRSASASLQVNPIPIPVLSSITLATATTGGLTMQATANLSLPAPVGGAVVSLTSNTPAAPVPATVVVPEGQTKANFNIVTIPVATAVSATISGTYPTGITRTATMTINPPALTGFTIAPASVPGGQGATGTVTIGVPAPAPGITASLSSNAPAIAIPPANVTIPEGATSATFPITTTIPTNGITATLTAVGPLGASRTATLSVQAIADISIVFVSKPQLAGGMSTVGTVQLNQLAPADVTIALSSDNPVVTVPPTMTIPTGVQSATFTITTAPVSTKMGATISATYPGRSTKTSAITIYPVIPVSLTLPAQVSGGQTATAVVTLSGPAPAGGLSLALSTYRFLNIFPPREQFNVPGRAPSTFVVPAGAVTASFPVTTFETDGFLLYLESVFDGPPPGGQWNQTSMLVTRTLPTGNAAYDTVLKAPRCSSVEAACDTGGLIDGRNFIGPEDHAPNTINSSCNDGFSADETYYHRFESLDRLSIATLDGSALAAGKTVRVTATIWGFPNERLMLFSAPDATNPVWTPIATITTTGTNQQVLSTTFTLPAGSLQAIRGRFGEASLPATPCTTSPAFTFTDYDDLIFAADNGGPPTNIGPVVNAGADQTIALPPVANLSGTVTDDGLPNPPGAITTTWTKVSGPGTVTFGDDSARATTATFSLSGNYVLQLSASDGALTTSDIVAIAVNVGTTPNQPPVVNAGPDQSVIIIPGTATLAGLVADDGAPNPPGVVTRAWSVVSGPGTATFDDATALQPVVTFSALGVYTLRLTANDGLLSASDDVVVTVLPVPNKAPTVNAGSDQTVTLPAMASLIGAVQDDGLPAPPAVFTTTWTTISGPGTVTFGAPTALLTTAAFSAPGSYTLRLTANDGALSASDDVVVTVNPVPNAAPTANAGADQTIVLPAAASLAGTATDDGLPGPLTTVWTKVSGPGTVTFAAPAALTTTATFSTAGTYTLRLTANDGALSASDDVVVTVNPTPNVAPTVNAGPDQTISLPAAANLTGTATDDGLPGALTTAWTKVNGPGTVTFAAPAALTTTATFSAAGTYTLRLTASDGALASNDTIVVTVNPVPPNAAPAVNAGPDQTITLPAVANLVGTVSDDGRPNPPAAVTVTWTKVSGPGTVTFGNANARTTTATFSTSGSYVLRLTANDSALSANDSVAITVNPLPLKAQYRITEVKPSDAHIKPHLDVYNTGNTSIPLSQIKIRYWYTIDTQQPQTITCDFAQVGCSKITSNFVTVSPARTGADRYVEIGFTSSAGNLAAGGHTGLIQLRWNKNNWSNYTETNDYSYSTGASTPAPTSFVDWSRVTVYQNGTRIWGVEP